jgi:hypothetical protein
LGDIVDERALGAVAGKNVHSIITAFEGVRAVVKTESVFRFFRAVAAEAGGIQNGLDIAGEINGDGSGGRQFGFIHLGGGGARAEQEKPKAAANRPSAGMPDGPTRGRVRAGG